jgi:hypothetical protein
MMRVLRHSKLGGLAPPVGVDRRFRAIFSSRSKADIFMSDGRMTFMLNLRLRNSEPRGPCRVPSSEKCRARRGEADGGPLSSCICIENFLVRRQTAFQPIEKIESAATKVR